jgi:hypothetical protein
MPKEAQAATDLTHQVRAPHKGVLTSAKWAIQAWEATPIRLSGT